MATIACNDMRCVPYKGAFQHYMVVCISDHTTEVSRNCHDFGKSPNFLCGR